MLAAAARAVLSGGHGCKGKPVFMEDFATFNNQADAGWLVAGQGCSATVRTFVDAAPPEGRVAALGCQKTTSAEAFTTLQTSPGLPQNFHVEAELSVHFVTSTEHVFAQAVQWLGPARNLRFRLSAAGSVDQDMEGPLSVRGASESTRGRAQRR